MVYKVLNVLMAMGIFFSVLGSWTSWAQQPPKLNPVGVQGSAGAGFADFQVKSPQADFRLDRGVYLAVGGERGFNVLNLYVTFTLSYLDAEGTANYSYTNLSTSTTYTVDDIKFKSRMMDASLGLKLKLIDGYWFRPYVEGGGTGGYHEVTYTNKQSELNAQGTDFKKKDAIMGSGYYYEGGLEIQFSDRFGIKAAARFTDFRTKELETLANRPLHFTSEIYYLSALVGF